jgi:hypothetical protein
VTRPGSSSLSHLSSGNRRGTCAGQAAAELMPAPARPHSNAAFCPPGAHPVSGPPPPVAPPSGPSPPRVPGRLCPPPILVSPSVNPPFSRCPDCRFVDPLPLLRSPEARREKFTLFGGSPPPLFYTSHN